MTYVTCPIMRYHPAVVAQKAATVGLLSDGRFTLGLGSGENLNEHVIGQGWPPANVRHEMFGEAVDIISELFDGGYVNYVGLALPGGLREGVGPARAAGADRGRGLGRPVDRASSRRKVDHLIAVEPEADLISKLGRRRAETATAARSASCRSAGTPTANGRRRARTSSSAGSAAAGRSTPSCRVRPASRARPSSSGRRTSPTRSRAAPTSRASSRRSASSPGPGSPTSRWCRSATRTRRSSSASPRRSCCPRCGGA